MNEMTAFERELRNTERNMELVNHLVGSPIEPFLSGFNSYGGDGPWLYAKISTVEDLNDFAHCAEKTEFKCFDVQFPPSRVSGDTCTCVVFYKSMADGKRIHLHVSIDNWVVTEVNKMGEIPF